MFWKLEKIKKGNVLQEAKRESSRGFWIRTPKTGISFFLVFNKNYAIQYHLSRIKKIYLGYGKEVCLILRNTVSNEFKSFD